MEKVTSVDLFCGAGGTSTGLAAACKDLGAQVELIAVNHWTIAVETHKKNHPWATHYCEAIEKIDPRKVVPSGRLKLLVASPECTHHAKARGARPMNDQSRAQCWHIIKWCTELYVENILIENVEEFIDYGPLGADGRPMKSKKGETFQAFIRALESMDYRVEYKILNSADFGDATTRKRLFILCRRPSHKKIFWPHPSHTKTPEAGELFAKHLKPWVAAKKIIDWKIEGQSIFSRKHPLKRSTLERIAAGIKKFCGAAAEPFLIILRQYMDAMSANGPLPEIRANGNHVATCEPKPGDFILQQQSGGAPRSVDKPAPTIAGKGAQALVQPQSFMIPFYNEREGQAPRTHDVNAPVPSIPATGSGKFGLIEPELDGFILPQNSSNNPRSVKDPVPTLTTTSRGVGLVKPKAFIVKMKGKNQESSLEQPDALIITPGGTDLGDGRSVNDPLATVMGKDRFAVVEPKAFLVSPGHGEGVDRRTHSVDAPLKSQTGSNEFAVVEPESFVFSMEHSGKKKNGKGKDGAFVLPTNHGKNDKRVHSIRKPMPTITSVDAWAMAKPCIIKYNGTGKANSVEEPLDTVTAKDRFGLMIPGVGVVGLDIRFRMLRPHELAAAMGFPKNYEFMGTREQQVKQIGNAVACNTAKALCKALLED
jgi:DNA (cytosine-5)-methyltransferase 1